MGMESAFDSSRRVLPCLYDRNSLHVSFLSLVIQIWTSLIKDRPESPRWLAAHDMLDEAHFVVAQTNARGNLEDPVVLLETKEIVDTITFEKQAGQSMSPLQIFKTPVNRRRLFIAATPAIFANIVGNNIATYYLGAELETAGITDSVQQLKAVSDMSSSDDSLLTSVERCT
jgi:hypothetical protein